jgi:large subunit ribosomal protein L3
MITKGILGIKGTTERIFSEAGDRIPVTRIHTSPCYVVGMKTMDVDGYWSVQLGFGETKNIKKSAEGLFKKAGMKAPLHFLREIRFDTAEVIENGKKKGLKVADLELWVGQELKASDLFSTGEDVTITGISKGKGFQGVVKRHGFKGGKRTHGQSDRERAPGSIGSGTTIGRVFKGKKMAGRMGSDTVTIKNLEVVDVADDSLGLKGVLPGVPGGLIIIRSHVAAPEKPVEEAPAIEDTPVTEETN